MHHKFRTGPLLIPTILLTTLTLVACSNGTDKAPPAHGPMPVTVLEMRPQSVPTSIEVMAQTEGARETEVRARVGGIITKRLYQEGQPVKAGQPLFQIDRAPFEIALAEARARSEQTEREMKRLKPLIEVRAVAQKDYDDTVTANTTAQAMLRQAQLNLGWTTVTAPVSGTTGRAIKSEGNLISTADSLLTSIYQSNPIWVRFSLGESDLAKFPNRRVTSKVISGVQMILADGTTYEKPGRLNFLAANIDTTLGTQQMRAEFDNSENQLLPGQFVRIRLQTGTREGAYLVPQGAVVLTEQGAILMTVGAENKVTPKSVKTGDWLGKDWVILSGLNPGDKVIIDNLIKLRPGIPVEPKPPGAQGKDKGNDKAAAPASAPAKH